MIVDWKRLALDPADHRLLDRKNKEVLYSRIAKYVAVRRNRGEQMKTIVLDGGATGGGAAVPIFEPVIEAA
jgi:hypothetical protein